MKKISILAILAILLLFVSCQPRYIFIPIPSGDDTPEEEPYIPNVYDNDAFAKALSEIQTGDTVELKLAAGTYTEQVAVPAGANVTIIGAGEGKTILSTPVGDRDLTVVDAYSGETISYTGTIVVNNGTLTLKNLTVKSNTEDNYFIGHPGDGTQRRMCNLAVINSSIYAENVVFTDNVFSEGYEGMQNGFGIYIVGSGNGNNAYFDNCTVQNFNKCGVLVREGVESFTFTNGKIIGNGSENTLTAQNGMQISCADYTIEGNTISELGYTGVDSEKWGACGVLLVSTSNVTYSDSDVAEIIGNNTFIDVQTECDL